MNINKEILINKINQKVESLGYDKEQIQFIALTGSYLIKKFENLKDVDTLIIVNNLNKEYIHLDNIEIEGVLYDLFIEDAERYSKRLNFEIETPRNIYNIYNNFYDIIYGNNTYDFDPFQHKDKYEKLIKEEIYYAGFYKKSKNPNPIWKKFVAPYLFYQVITNQKYELTQEMIDTAKTIYNGEDIYIIAKIGWNLNLRLNNKIWGKHMRRD